MVQEPRTATPTISEAHRAIDGAADGLASTLVALSHRIHANPEVGFQEQPRRRHGWRMP